MSPLFVDRVEAGQHLAARLADLNGLDVVVLGLPRGGVPVAAEVARALRAPLDIVLVRKIGVPYQRELAMGAIGEGGVRVIDGSIVGAAGVTDEELEAVERGERMELERRARVYRGSRPPVALSGRVAVVVDDGIATGATASVACRIARARGARRVVFAAPVGARSSVERLRADGYEVVCVATPRDLGAIGELYEDFRQTSDHEVCALLDAATSWRSGLVAVRTAAQSPAGERPKGRAA